MNKITDEQITLVTETANAILKKKYDLHLEEWQVSYTLQAVVFINEFNKRVKNDCLVKG